MAIFREVETTVYCDVCGEYVIGWHSKGQGVSRAWAAYHARQKGCTTGKKIVCKKCRIERKKQHCSLIKRYGQPQQEQSGACLGFSGEYDDGFIEIWEYKGEQRSKCVCKVKEENDIDCYKRAIEALERYGKERERITYEKRAG
ncbi:MAG: hypothetical protein ACOYBL_04090 [Lachnospiraceae bacterium]|jgi:hypothetical protein